MYLFKTVFATTLMLLPTAIYCAAIILRSQPNPGIYIAYGNDGQHAAFYFANLDDLSAGWKEAHLVGSPNGDLKGTTISTTFDKPFKTKIPNDDHGQWQAQYGSEVWNCRGTALIKIAIAGPVTWWAAYVCNPPHKDPIIVSFALGGSQVVLDTEISAHDVFNQVYTNIGDHEFNPDAVAIPHSKCTIQFDGFGAATGATVRRMAKVLVDVVSSQKGISSSVEVDKFENTCITTGTGATICGSQPNGKKRVTKIASKVQIDVSNQPPQGSNSQPSIQGTLKYQISCPAGAGQDCNECEASKAALTGASLIPVIGVIFGLAGAIINAACLACK
jgi:hypothetical protein